MGEEVENPLFARFFHRVYGRDRGQGERDLRRELLAGMSGRVVEVGAGNGINFEHYPAGVEELIAVEPEPYLRGQAERAAAPDGTARRTARRAAYLLGRHPGGLDGADLLARRLGG